MLFADTGREYKADDADVTELAAMEDSAFNATAKFSRAQHAKTPKPEAKPKLPDGLFSHQADGGRTADGEETKPAQRPGLVAVAKARAAEFARQRTTH